MSISKLRVLLYYIHMKKSPLTLIIVIVGLIVFLGVYLTEQYNSLVTAKEQVSGQWAQVETQYQRRFDLIPNLVESVKGIMGQEKEVFGLIADARTKYSGAQTLSDKVDAANQVESALGRLLVVMENYPELKSSESVNNLMVQLEGTENRISVERGRFNDIVKTYNLNVKRFPKSILAGLFGFKPEPYFEAVENAQTPPQVKF